MLISWRRFASDVLGAALVEDLGVVGPGDEVLVLGDPPLERDRLVLGPAEPLQDDGVAALLVLDHVGRALDRSDLAHRGDGCRALPK